ncbi:hypothetical protein HM1_0025 [Heliomicrobium modesticaldum Ice1]|uniref:SipL SPOCS domain-containing protein n=1 Tax=Heliobacterium modesticaldum (strain ATCC 51547 / Ice1) TaxID=498761 RepID=B0THX7_HELMI|nr:DUF3794 domain-containing protein [Heliomicrobium modesticaldum]ABZ82650.1 hypothetical protein HM1_0025 [Heliomicrobium modesticaldum Ice1]
MSHSFDFIDDRFFDQRIKVPKVICQKFVQEIGDLMVPAPAGVTLDVQTGKLNQMVRLEWVGPPQLRAVTVLPNKVINQGVVPVRLLVDNIVAIQLLEIPFQGVIDCPGASPGDIVQKHDVQIEGFSINPVQILTEGVLTLHLILKVALHLCLVVASERILKVNAAETFC